MESRRVFFVAQMMEVVSINGKFQTSRTPGDWEVTQEAEH